MNAGRITRVQNSQPVLRDVQNVRIRNPCRSCAGRVSDTQVLTWLHQLFLAATLLQSSVAARQHLHVAVCTARCRECIPLYAGDALTMTLGSSERLVL